MPRVDGPAGPESPLPGVELTLWVQEPDLLIRFSPPAAVSFQGLWASGL